MGVFLGIEPRLLVAVGVGLGARRFDSLAGPLFDVGEDIVTCVWLERRTVMVEMECIIDIVWGYRYGYGYGYGVIWYGGW